MNYKQLLRTLLLLMLAAILAFPASAQAEGKQVIKGVHVTPIGNPTWKPVDFHLFAAPFGHAPDYAGYGTTTAAILPPPNHVAHPQLGIGPGAPHVPPYTTEMAKGVTANHYHEGNVFKTTEFSNGMGVYVVWMNVPAPGVTGSSPDFASGPIIPNSLFPIHAKGITYQNGKQFDAALADVQVPALNNDLNPPFNVDGHSHFPFYVTDNADFGPAGAKLDGTFKYDLTMIDQTNQGWHIEVQFQVTP